MDDGYHEIETLFERISIFDRIAIEPAKEKTAITCTDPRVPVDENSLMGQTVKAFNERHGKDLHFRISLEKNIPVSAGLGGGSSDAAALLKGLNRIAGEPLDDGALLSMARALGADVPFFLNDCSFGYGSGRGDIIQKVETPMDIGHVLISPPFEVSTKKVYDRVSAFDLTKNTGVDKMFSAFLSENDINGLAENLRNDLQTIVLRDFPVLEKVFFELRKAGAKGTLLSGSGPTVFGIFELDRVMEAGERIRQFFSAEKDWRVYVARTYK